MSYYCNHVRYDLFSMQIIVNDWLPRVADLVEAMRKFWEDLVPMNSQFGGRVATLFNCIHALMSQQLQGLIKRSLDHLFETIDSYKVQFKCVRTFFLIIWLYGFFHRMETRSKNTMLIIKN